jgi:hypothetical protein
VGGFHNLLEILFLLHCMRYPKMKKDVNRMKSFVNAQITIVLRLPGKLSLLVVRSHSVKSRESKLAGEQLF